MARGRAGEPFEQGVRAAAGAGGRANSRVHTGGAVAGGLGLSRHLPDPHDRLPRPSSAQEAQRHRRAVRGQRLGSRLSTRRREAWLMSGPLTMAGGSIATGALTATLLARYWLAGRDEAG